MTVSIHEIVEPLRARLLPSEVDAVETMLIAREDAIADLLRLAGAQFGLFPFIVSEVLAQAGLGTPLTDTEREYVRRQFVEGMEELARRQRGDT